MESSSFASALRKWSVAGLPTRTPQDTTEYTKAAEVMKAYFKDRARELVSASAHRPVLYTYASDGTPLRATTTFRAKIQVPGTGETVKVIRKGGEGTDILIERGYVVTRDGLGRFISTPLLRDGTPLSVGKGTWRLVLCAKRFLPICDCWGTPTYALRMLHSIVPTSVRSVQHWPRGRQPTTRSGPGLAVGKPRY